MQLTLDTKELMSKLELVGRVSTKHVTLPVLQCVLLEAKNNQLILRATNLEIAIEATAAAQVKADGMVAVPASVLIQTVNLNNDKDTTLSLNEGNLLVKTNNSSTEIKCIPHEEFPSIPKLTGASQVINSSMFSLGIKTAVFAASQSSIKPELGSVYVFQKKEHTLTFVTTDSFRLVEKTVAQKGVILENSLLIPYKNALEISRICDLKNSDPVCRINDNQFSLEFADGVYLTSRLTSGSFPDYEQIIPKEYIAHTAVLKNDLIHAFKKTNVFLNRFLQVVLAIDKKTITISANSGEVGTTTETIPASTEGDPLNLSFNQRYLSEALPHFVDDSLMLHLGGIGRPMVIKGVSDASLRYLVMPMNK